MSDTQQHTDHTPPAPAAWSWYKKLGFRIIFIFFLAMSIPLASNWYTNVFTLDWLHPHYRDIYDIARFQPSFQRYFGGGRGNFDDGDGPAAPRGQGDAAGGGNNRGGGQRNHPGADSTQANHAVGQGRNGGRHHHRDGDSTRAGGEGRQFAGGGRNGEGGFRRHHRDSTKTGGEDNRFAGAGRNGKGEGTGEGGFRRHHRDSTQAGNGEGGFRRHHRDGDSTRVGGDGNGDFARHRHRDSTQAGGEGQRFAGAGRNGGGFRRHRDGDSTQTGISGFGRHRHRDSTLAGGGRFAAGDKKFGRHHRDSLNTLTDSTGHDSTKVAATATGGRGRGGANNNAPLPKKNYLADYTDWGIAFLIGIVGGLIWTLFDRKSKSYNILYYWIRVVVRYRAGIGIIGFGFTKLFPTQMPYPSLGLLNSNFGDFTAQKIYWMSVGIVPWYQVFGGIVEIAAGTMLFFRKTTTLGAILLAGALGDITFVNYAYDGGVHVYAFYFVFLSLFLIADDVPKLYNLLILERYTVPFRIYPDFRKPVLKYARIGLKVLTFLIFFVVLTYTEVINFKYDPYKQPSTAGVKQLRGNYHVTEFKINGQDLPYNPLDSTRWQEATFENWTTLSFKVNRPVVIDPSNGGGSPMKDIQRTFEITGVAGGQRAFHYYADTIDKVLYLQDKNAMASRGGGRGGRGGRRRGPNAQKREPDNWISQTALQHIGDEKKMIDPRAWSTRRDREFAQKGPEPKRNRMILKYSTVDGSRVILSGVDERKDSIYVVLDRYDRKYTLPKSTLVAGKY